MIIHRHPCLALACLLLTVCGLTAASFGQLPPGVVNAADPPRATIEGFVTNNVKLMLDADPANWGRGRSLLLNEVSKNGATPGFFDVYADVINAQLIPLTKNPDARIRLNAAIVAARVAAKAGNGRLEPVTESFLKDRSDAVVLWGLQSAKYVVPALLAALDAPHADTIAKEAVQATKDHMTPAVIEEAYRTLLLDPKLPDADRLLNDIPPSMLSGFLPNPMALFEYRIKLYDEVDAPTQPIADTWASAFLINDKVWTAQTAAQHGQTLNMMLGLLKGAAKQNATASSPEMLDVMKRTGQGFQVLGTRMKQPEMAAAGKKMSELPQAPAPDEITTAITNLETAVKGVGLPAATTAGTR